MALLQWLGKWSLRLLLLMLAVLILWLLYAVIAYRDIPYDELKARYGGNVSEVVVDGQPIAVRVDGDLKDGRPQLLLIHSHYFNSRMWQPWVEQLKGRFTIVRYDLTSHGLTGPELSGDYSMARDQHLLEGLVEQLGMGRFAIAGSSLGGNIAFHYAAEHRAKVSHLLLVNSGGLPKAQSSKRNAEAIPDWFYRLLYLLPESVWRSFIEWMAVNDDVATAAFVTEFHDMLRGTDNRKAEMRRMASFDVGDPQPVLAKISAPVLLQWGQGNPQLPVAQVERFRGLLSGAARVESQIYAGAGHLLPLEQPKASAMDAAAFILGAPQ